jgi:hypothetical protein
MFVCVCVCVCVRLPVLHSHYKVWGSGGIDPRILTSELHGGKRLVSHPSHLVFIPGKVVLYRRLDVYQGRSSRCGDEDYFLPTPGIEPQSLDRPVIIPTEIS